MNGRVLVLLAAPVAALAAGCGGSSPNAVANLGTGAATTAATGGSSQPSTSDRHASALQFSECMRKNGVPNFPDPSSSGGISIGPSMGLNPNSAQFRAARSKCQKLLPNGGRPSQAQIAKAEASALAFSKCMRAHGLPNFPDPQFDTSGGGIGIRIGGKGGGLDPGSPIFQRAQKACQNDLPGKGRGARVGTGP